MKWFLRAVLRRRRPRPEPVEAVDFAAAIADHQALRAARGVA